MTAFFAVAAQSTPVPSIALLPSSGAVSGAPGSVVGWGFTLTYNAPSDWVVLTGSEFTGSQVYGTYVDYLSLPSAPLYVAGPAPEPQIVTQPWNSSLQLGVGEFDIDSTAPSSISITGDIVIHYSVFSQDPNNPNFDPDTSTVVADATISDPVQVNISPEPGSLLLMSTALLPLAFTCKRRRLRQARDTAAL